MKKLCVNADYCKGCLICVEVCKVNAIQASAQINAKGYLLPMEKDMKRCNACGLCELMCPDFAITIEESDE